jgi:hypothetical protein
MSDLQSPDRLRDHAIAALVPFFLESATADVNNARLAATALLADYRAITPKELQLAAQVIALSWASLACLRTAIAARNLTTDEMLTLQDQALALDRKSQKSSKILDARRKERAKNPRAVTPENFRWDEGVFQLTINQALDKLNDANTKMATYMETLTPKPVAVPVVAPVPEATVEKTRLPFMFGEQMTQSVLARLARP